MEESGPQKTGRVTLKQIAHSAGVSLSTASLVLSGKAAERRISASAARRVREVAHQLDYAPNLLVRSIRHGRTNIFSLYSSFQNRERGDLYMDRISSAIERAAGRLHYDVLVHCDFTRPINEIYNALNGGRADGLIFFGPTEGDPLVERLRSSRLPTVLLNHADETGKISSVREDMHDGMRQVGDELIRLGHRRIAAISGGPWSDADARISVLRTRLALDGISVPDRWVIPVIERDTDCAEKALRFLLSEPEPPTALFCWHDRVGYFLLDACERLGIAVPEQLSLIGYDGLHWPSASPHVLNSVAVDMDTLAESAVYLLDNIVQKKVIPPVSELYPVTLSPGTTLAPPR
ncbi:MAG: LacI family DNA-binding transcriptional regulator [Armatimonadaceae bacterium]